MAMGTKAEGFATASQLGAWLEANGIDTSAWGQGEHKGVVHLWRELQTGDASLQEEPPMRQVTVVQVLVRRGDAVLVERVQELASGQRRGRDQPPSEKLKSGESYLDGAMRCLREELGAAPSQVSLNPASHRRWMAQEDSPSYPGLPTRYTMHAVEATVAGLPEAGFWRENRAFAGGEDPVRRHYWEWRPPEGSETGFEP